MVDELTLQRRFFAEEVQTICNLKTPRLVEAFATVPRERFLPPGPWLIRGEGDLMSPARTTPDAHPRHVHHNVVVAIDPARQLFNGMPSAIGTWIDALALQPGQRVLHVGCGLGYYSALMAHCVGQTGLVVAVDVDDALAADARSNLASYGEAVDVRCGNGTELGDESFDAILVNAGMTHPHEAWLAALRPGGRLVLPLTCGFPQMGPTIGKGLVLLLTDNGSEPLPPESQNGLTARLLSFVAIYSALGIRDRGLEEALGKAMARNPWPAIKRLRRDAHEASATCWLHGDTFCISLE